MALRTEHLPELDTRYTRMSGTDPHPSEWCPECDCPPWRPHEDGCSKA